MSEPLAKHERELLDTWERDEDLPADKGPLVSVTVPAEIGALTQWRREVAARTRRRADIDPLTRAAILEANARDELRYGMQGAARQSRLDAADTIIAAAAERAS